MNKFFCHNCLHPWPIGDESINTIVTSPPYWGLRDYLHPEQIGQEPTPEDYVKHMIQVFTEAYRVLKPDGTLWLNLADTYWGGKGQSGGGWKGKTLNASAQQIYNKGQTRPQDRSHPFIKPKDLVGIPWTVALALRDSGWYLRQDVIWNKSNPLPESVKDRCTKSHEYLFLLSKSRYYYFDSEAIKVDQTPASVARLRQYLNKQNGSRRKPETKTGNMKAVEGFPEKANKKSVWTVATNASDLEFCLCCKRLYSGSEKSMIKREMRDNKIFSTCLCGRVDGWVEHFATFPELLIKDCILAGSPPGGIVLDPFMGSGTTAMVAASHGRQFIGLDVNPDYVALSDQRARRELGMFYEV